jgi:hypothetical protein
MENEENALPREEVTPAERIVDPAGPPQPVEKADDLAPPPESPAGGDPVLAFLTAAGVGLVALGGLVVLPILCSARATMGATRSAKLQWQDRQGQIERAVRQDQADPQASHEPI